MIMEHVFIGLNIDYYETCLDWTLDSNQVVYNKNLMKQSENYTYIFSLYYVVTICFIYA